MNIRIVITSHNRPAMCRSTVDAIRSEGHTNIHVYLDGGIEPYKSVHATQHRLMKPAGRRHYRDVWTHILDDAKNAEWDCIVFLPDDFAPAVERPIERAVELLKYTDVLVPVVDQRGRGPCWVPVDPEPMGEVYRTGWVDGCFVCLRAPLARIGWAVPELPADHFDTNQSSGVGKYLSLAFHTAGVSVCQVTDTLYRHGGHTSQMHFAHRKTTPL